MERWDKIVLDVNAICANLVGNVCSCLVYILLLSVTQHHIIMENERSTCYATCKRSRQCTML